MKKHIYFIMLCLFCFSLAGCSYETVQGPSVSDIQADELSIITSDPPDTPSPPNPDPD